MSDYIEMTVSNIPKYSRPINPEIYKSNLVGPFDQPLDYQSAQIALKLATDVFQRRQVDSTTKYNTSIYPPEYRDRAIQNVLRQKGWPVKITFGSCSNWNKPDQYYVEFDFTPYTLE